MRAEDVMPQGESEGRTVYVLAYAQAEPRRPNPGAGPSPGPIAATERELEIERELELEMEMGTDDESDGPQPGPEDLAAVGASAGEAELEAAMCKPPNKGNNLKIDAQKNRKHPLTISPQRNALALRLLRALSRHKSRHNGRRCLCKEDVGGWLWRSRQR